MKHVTVSQGRDLRTSTSTDPIVQKDLCLPMVILEGRTEYSVVLNLLGIKKEDIVVDVDEKRRELGVYVGKKTEFANRAAFWIFGVPRDGLLQQVSVKYKSGGLQVTVPRLSMVHRQNRTIEFLPAAFLRASLSTSPTAA